MGIFLVELLQNPSSLKAELQISVATSPYLGKYST